MSLSWESLLACAKWEHDIVFRGWRVVCYREGKRYQSAALFTRNDTLLADTCRAMATAPAAAWYQTGEDTFTLPCGV